MLKVGDKVRIRPSSEWVRDRDDPGVDSVMFGYANKEVTIMDIFRGCCYDDDIYYCTIAEDNGCFTWYPKWFEGIDSAKIEYNDFKFKVGDFVGVKFTGRSTSADGLCGLISTATWETPENIYCVEFSDSFVSIKESKLVNIGG